MLEILKTILLGIIEGITEWLPISSTGHLILAQEFIKLDVREAFWDMFLVVIQLGAILAVVVMYFHKLNPFSPKKKLIEKKHTWQLWFRVIVACLPAIIIALPFDDLIEKYLNNFQVVAAMLILYGILFILMENRNQSRRIQPKITTLQQIDYKTALFIGLFQVLAVIPGTSRSGATILGAMLIGTSRYIAAEFSFFLAIPVMFGASLLKIVKFFIDGGGFTSMEVGIMLLGMVVAFLVSMFAIRFLMNFIKKHDFKPFGYYRIVLGTILIIYWLAQVIIK